MIYYAEPQVLIIKSAQRDFESLQFNNNLLIKRVHDACTFIAEYPDDCEGIHLTGEINKLLPEVSLIEYVLQTEQLMAFHEFESLYGLIPTYEYYDEGVWPVPSDFTPENVYDWGLYDINLIFGRQ